MLYLGIGYGAAALRGYSLQYDHTEGNTVSGGFVYAGERVPLLQGKYVFGNIPRGRLFYTKVADMQLGKQAPVYALSVAVHGWKTDLETLTQNQRVDLRFGIDSQGELYIFTKSSGTLYQMVAAQNTAAASKAGSRSKPFNLICSYASPHLHRVFTDYCFRFAHEQPSGYRTTRRYAFSATE